MIQDYRPISIEEVSPNEHDENHDDEDVSTVPMLNDTSKQAEKPHICTECGKRFSRKDNLKRHLNTHTGSKPFSCHHCDYSFALKQNLTTHLRTHTGERPFSCRHCDYTCALVVLSTNTYAHTQEKNPSLVMCAGNHSL